MPDPFLPTVAAALVIDRCAPDSVRAQLLPGLVAGRVVGALSVSGGVEIGADLLAAGESAAVLGAPDAAVLAVVAGDDVVLVEADDGGVTVIVTLTEGRVLRGAARRARTVFRILASAEAVGISWAALDMAVEYAKVREQFGRTIGTFQAVKPGQRLVRRRGGGVARDRDPGPQRAVQHSAHGGIGFTWEHDAHLYLRRDFLVAGDRGGVRTRRAARHGHHRLGDADDRAGRQCRPTRTLGRTRAARPGDVVSAVLRAGRGSDAAAVRTAAKKVEGGWRITGLKVWTWRTCQWGLATVRTDPDAPKHAGVTMMASTCAHRG